MYTKYRTTALLRLNENNYHNKGALRTRKKILGYPIRYNYVVLVHMSSANIL